MNVGKIRKARVGEIPTHYATEAIEENEAVVTYVTNAESVEGLTPSPIRVIPRVLLSTRMEDVRRPLPIPGAMKQAEVRYRRSERRWLITVIALGVLLFGDMLWKLF